MALVGYGSFENPDSNTKEAIHDVHRVKYMADYLDPLLGVLRYEHGVVAPVHFLQKNFTIAVFMKATLKMILAIFNYNCLYSGESVNVF